MKRRTTDALVRVATTVMNDPDGRYYGYELSKASHVRSGALYPMLDRFLADGWVIDEWELPGEETAKKPRRYYSLTDEGRRHLGGIAAEAKDDPRFGFAFGGAT